MANSQQRCVFVGNIPYDATEEQLVQICEEVGPVVKFRLVIDRETGKPKGYGFCEYKDEETALSARRNLHGYDINGRQLRVDFAENDKNNDKSKEQGRGGPGMATNSGPQKQIGGPVVHGDPSIHQPVGLQDAMAAAIMMAGVVGGGQSQTNTNNISQNGILNQPIPGTDPLTLHLAKISKGHLTEVLSEFKTMATQNKEQARQLLLAHPQLSKAVFQAHIMMKLVPPHLLQIPNARQLTGPLAQQQPPLSGLVPPVAQNKMPLVFMPQGQTQSQLFSSHLGSSQYATTSVPLQPRFQTPTPLQQHQHSTLLGLQSLHPQQPMATSSIQTHSLLQDNNNNVFKASSSMGPSILNNGDKDNHLLHNNPGWGHNSNKFNPHSNGRFLNENDQITHPPKLLKMEDGKASVPLPGTQISKPGPTGSQKQNNELPLGVDSALLEQVLNLTPDQLSSLPPDQQQQVIQLQQMLRQSTESRT